MTEIIKVVVENHQIAGRVFPGWRSKYPQLADIPGLRSGATAVVAEVRSGDMPALSRDFQRAGMRIFECRSLGAGQESAFQPALDKWEQARAETERRALDEENKKILKKLAAKWRKLHKSLDSDGQALWREFEPEQALKKELESGIQELEDYLSKKAGALKEWKALYKKLTKQNKKAFKGFQYKLAGLDALDAKLQEAKELLEQKVEEKERAVEEFLEDQKEAAEERLEEAEDLIKDKLSGL